MLIEPLVVIVPAYNAEPTLAKVVKDVRRNLPGAWIIGVDDGSTDGSRKLLKTVADETIEFDQNRGKGAALRAGFDAALKKGAAAVLTIDSDGQHDAAFAPAIVGALDRADIVIGTRDLSGAHVPKHRRIANMISSAATRAVSGGKVRDSRRGIVHSRRSATQGARRRRQIRVRNGFHHPRSPRRVHDRERSDIHHLRLAELFPRIQRCMARDQGAVATSRGDLSPLRLLCTNDDGILAYGLACLVEAAEPLGEITVVAPDREQSATSHSLTLHHPIRPIERGERRFQVDGTPTDCVMLAVEALMPERPDYVLSGINHGQNMGEDVLYSGTVAAAMEGLSLGIPSVAISFAGGDLRADVSMLRDQIEPLRKLLGHVLSMPSFRRIRCSISTAAVARGRHQGCSSHEARTASVLGFAQADAGSVGTSDLLDRWRIHRLVRRRDVRLSRDSGRLHIRHSVAPRSDHHAMLASAEGWWQLP